MHQHVAAAASQLPAVPPGRAAAQQEAQPGLRYKLGDPEFLKIPNPRGILDMLRAYLICSRFRTARHMRR